MTFYFILISMKKKPQILLIRRKKKLKLYQMSWWTFVDERNEERLMKKARKKFKCFLDWYKKEGRWWWWTFVNEIKQKALKTIIIFIRKKLQKNDTQKIKSPDPCQQAIHEWRWESYFTWVGQSISTERRKFLSRVKFIVSNRVITIDVICG